MEEDAHEKLPGGIFNRGIVRGYCQQLALDESEWLQRFSAAVESGAEPDWNAFAESVRQNRARAGACRRKWWGVAAMAVVLVVLGWAAWHFMLKTRLTARKTIAPVVGAKACGLPAMGPGTARV